MAYILVAEDDKTLRDGLQVALESEGYETRVCADGEEALAAFAERCPDLVLLDIMMPRRGGFEVCAEIRCLDAAVPVIFLTAKTAEADQVFGLGLGADDYIAKPFRIRVLLARVEAALRRASPRSGSAPASAIFSIGAAQVNPRGFCVDPCDGTPPQTLTVRELALLRAFAAHPGEVITRDALLDEAWGVDYEGSPRTLDQHVHQVRRKLGRSADRIVTVHRVGYRYLL
jgi:DNA-binding response OmpR family regulator